ncbi:hypothetical protein [Pseudomonas sp. BF-R-19]|uniref:hypothetical protein n=1 Tax=Pseudomonas sp. BF-R-19 TaxID=2832397 RepID=UPI001CBD98AC|nr:hypothetical protein [Pseudomonas sp. BF-R-19]
MLRTGELKDFTGGGYTGDADARNQAVEAMKTDIAAPGAEARDCREELQCGVATGYSIDPLESAISSTAQAASESVGLTAVILQDHLKLICELQRQKLAAIS